jgi:hypothetical protein
MAAISFSVKGVAGPLAKASSIQRWYSSVGHEDTRSFL